ncbi:hypothetical protein HHI36_002623, partial [Cryptolaemus montrouzieri]
MVNYDQLRDKLRNEKWNDIYHSYDTESASKYFIEQLQGCIRSCTKKIRIKKQKFEKKGMDDGHLLRSLNDVELKMKFRKYRNKLTELIKTRKNEYSRGEIVKNGGNSEGLW